MTGYSGAKGEGYNAGGGSVGGGSAGTGYGAGATSQSYNGAGKMPAGQYGAKGAGKNGAMPYMPGQEDISMIFGTQNYVAMLYKNGMVEVYNSGGKSKTYLPDGSVKDGASLDSLLEGYRQGGEGMAPSGKTPIATPYGAGKNPMEGLPYGQGMSGYDPLNKQVPSYGDITDKLGKGNYSGAAPADKANTSSQGDKKGYNPSELMKKAPAERYSDMSKASDKTPEKNMAGAAGKSRYGGIPSSTVPIPEKPNGPSKLEKAVAYSV